MGFFSIMKQHYFLSIFFLSGCEYNENYIHATDELYDHESSKYSHGLFDLENNNHNNSSIYRASNYPNPTFDSKISLCLNDDFMTIVNNNESNHANCNYRNSDFRHKRESPSWYDDENENTLNFVAPSTNNAYADGSKSCMKTSASNRTPTAGKLFFKLAVNRSSRARVESTLEKSIKLESRKKNRTTWNIFNFILLLFLSPSCTFDVFFSSFIRFPFHLSSSLLTYIA